MLKVEDKKALVEVDEVLNHLSNEDYIKIPNNIIRFIKENKDKEYTWFFDEEKSLGKQNLSREAISILAYLNMEYLLNQEQKDFMKQILWKNTQKLENKKLYNLNEVFKKRKKI